MIIENNLNHRIKCFLLADYNNNNKNNNNNNKNNNNNNNNNSINNTNNINDLATFLCLTLDIKKS